MPDMGRTPRAMQTATRERERGQRAGKERQRWLCRDAVPALSSSTSSPAEFGVLRPVRDAVPQMSGHRPKDAGASVVCQTSRVILRVVRAPAARPPTARSLRTATAHRSRIQHTHRRQLRPRAEEPRVPSSAPCCSLWALSAHLCASSRAHTLQFVAAGACENARSKADIFAVVEPSLLGIFWPWHSDALFLGATLPRTAESACRSGSIRRR